MTGDRMLLLELVLLGVKTFQTAPTKEDLGTS